MICLLAEEQWDQLAAAAEAPSAVCVPPQGGDGHGNQYRSHAGGVAGGAVNSAVNAAGATRGAVGGLNAAGQLTSNSQGVFGLEGLNLSSAASNSTQGSLITSTSKNVHLDSGTQILLVSQAQASAQ